MGFCRAAPTEGEYWSKTRGYTYGTFSITSVEVERLKFTIPSGENLTVTRRDYEQTSILLDDYVAGVLSSDDVLEKSGRSAYIFSLVHMLRKLKSQPTLKALLSPKSRVFLKSEFAPVSNDWPAVSFTNEGPARDFGTNINPEHDLVVFAGTQAKETPLQYRANLLSAVRVRSEPVNSRLLIHNEVLEFFQGGKPNRFIWSLPVIEAWALVDLPSARDYVGQKYSVLGLGLARQSGIELSPAEITSLQDLRIRPIPLQIIQTDDLKEDLGDPLSSEFARILAGLRLRAQRGGSETKRVAPIRICDLKMNDLRQMWQSQGGKCKLCDRILPQGGNNVLLQISADRIDSNNANYDLANTQLTHLACNLGKNAASARDFV
jgi:hypothetical protein